MYYFKASGGWPAPCLPVDSDGNPVVADGKYVFDLEQAAVHFNTTAASLKMQWATSFEDSSPEMRRIVVGDAIADPHYAALRRKLSWLNEEMFDEFVTRCRIAGFSPWSSDIYPREDGDGDRTLMIEVGLMHVRRVAQRSGRYIGLDGPYFLDDAGKWHLVWLSKKQPVAARVGVFTTDRAPALWTIIKWGDYHDLARGEVSNLRSWKEKPSFRLGFVAEKAALMRVFGDGFGPRPVAQAREVMRAG